MTKGRIAILFGMWLWLLETAHFGWNLTAQSHAEVVWDLLAGCIISWGFGYGAGWKKRP